MNTKEAFSVGDLGKRFSDATIRMHEAIARAAGLSGTDHKYLSLLMAGGSMPAGQLAQMSGLTTGAVTALIDRLEKQGLVTREFLKDDRRKVMIVSKEEKIMRLLSPSFQLLRKKIQKLVSKRSKAEREIIGKYLVEAIAVMQEVTEEVSKNGNRKVIRKA